MDTIGDVQLIPPWCIPCHNIFYSPISIGRTWIDNFVDSPLQPLNNSILFSLAFIELITFIVVSTFNTLIPNSQWFLFHVTIVMGVIFSSEYPLKSVIYFNYSSLELILLEIALSQFRFAYFFPEFHLYQSDITSCVNLHVKNMLFNFIFFSGLDEYILHISRYFLSEGLCLSNFLFFIVLHATWKLSFFLQCEHIFPGLGISSFSFIIHATIFAVNHEPGFVVGALIIFLLVDLYY